MNTDKLREAFPQTTVFKDQGLISTFKSANIPAFLRDWILKRKADANGRVGNPDELRQYISKIIPQKSQKLEIVDEAQQGGATRKFLANIRVQLNISSNKHTFEIPDLDDYRGLRLGSHQGGRDQNFGRVGADPARLSAAGRIAPEGAAERLSEPSGV